MTTDGVEKKPAHTQAQAAKANMQHEEHVCPPTNPPTKWCVTFHADKDCTIRFSNPAVFNKPQIDLKKNQPKCLPVELQTNFEVYVGGKHVQTGWTGRAASRDAAQNLIIEIAVNLTSSGTIESGPVIVVP